MDNDKITLDTAEGSVSLQLSAADYRELLDWLSATEREAREWRRVLTTTRPVDAPPPAAASPITVDQIRAVVDAYQRAVDGDNGDAEHDAAHAMRLLLDAIARNGVHYGKPTAGEAMTMARAAQMAFDVQSACNLSGVVFWMARIMSFLVDAVPDTDARNRHPICRLFSEQISHLTRAGGGDSETYSVAYDACLKLAEQQ